MRRFLEAVYKMIMLMKHNRVQNHVAAFAYDRDSGVVFVISKARIKALDKRRCNYEDQGLWEYQLQPLFAALSLSLLLYSLSRTRLASHDGKLLRS